MTCSYPWAREYGPLVFTEGNMNQDFMSQNLFPWYNELPSSEDLKYIFQGDNAPCHTSPYAKWWKASHSLDVLEGWPAQIPDLNPIKNVWSELASYLRR
jgi:hypothetical protein